MTKQPFGRPAADISRRRFLQSTATALGAVALTPTWLHAQMSDECKILDELTKNWGAIKPMLASRYHRLNHVLFHYLRNNWGTLTDAQKRAIADVDLGWFVRRPSLRTASWDTVYNSQFWAAANGSGEDFLYYHRWMIGDVNRHLGALGPLRSWSRDAIPAPQGGCADESVPDFVPVFDGDVEIPSLQTRVREVKSDGFYWSRMVWWGQQFRDPSYLRTLTLGELGSRLESSVHNQMHIRWSDYPSNPGNPKGQIRGESDIDPKWDHPDYDTVFDEYSSHVHPIFFRLHRWLDNRINDWADAHGDEVQRYREPARGFEWFRPGRWVHVGDPWVGANGFTPERPGRIEQMETVFRILTGTDAELLEAAPATPRPNIISLRDLI